MTTNKNYPKLKVELMSFTNEPLKVIYNSFMNMHNEIPGDLKKVKIKKGELEDFMKMFVTQPHQTVFEYINTVWKISGGSRAFQTELVRTRMAAYSIQSLRIVNVNKFADNKDYLKPESIANNKQANELYEDTMNLLQERYKKLIELGMHTQDARNVLPLSIHSPITMSINLRALYHMSELRFCDNTAAEYREVMKQMREEIVKKMHPLLGEPMKPICLNLGYCPSPFPCKKYPNIPKVCTMDVSRWLKG